MFDFIQSFSVATNIEKSELMRKLVEHYFLQFFSSEKNETFKKLKKEFSKETKLKKAK